MKINNNNNSLFPSFSPFPTHYLFCSKFHRLMLSPKAIVLSSLLTLPLSVLANSTEITPLDNLSISSRRVSTDIAPPTIAQSEPVTIVQHPNALSYDALKVQDEQMLSFNSVPSNSSTDSGDAESLNASSPDTSSRAIYDFNKSVDSVTLRPVAKTYLKAPSPVKTGVSNFVDNIRQPSNAVNFLLQGNLSYAAQSVMKFSFNTVLGFAGILDILPMIPTHHTNVAQTVRTWGVSPGQYTVIPLLGPAHVIEYATIPVDIFLDPIGTIHSVATRNSVAALATVKERADVEPALVLAEQNSLDEYSFVKSAYVQKSQRDVENLIEARQTQFDKATE